ncbi:hypothetical protein [Vulcanisaeta souniana]|uniref:hypothetical protein n=1 Tax=Vulcanisaeta souniana TaxID=164452 RepID=UPI0006D0BF4A|nr:hypothetical protein [Vulcanisaeta souniana]
MLRNDTLFPEDLWNVTLSTMPANGVYNIRTIALESVDIYNNASFPIFVTGFTYSSAGSNYPLSVPTTEIAPGMLAEIPAQYIYGSSYEFASTWCDLATTRHTYRTYQQHSTTHRLTPPST